MYKKVDADTRVLKGDYLKYFDEYGKVKGVGVLVKKVVHPIFPLTASYYILKNINTRRCWKVNSRRYEFYYERHKTSSFDLSELKEIREIREKYMKEDEEFLSLTD